MDEELQCEEGVEAQEVHQGDAVGFLQEEEVVVVQVDFREEVHLVAVEDQGVDLLVEGVDLLSLFLLWSTVISGVWGLCVKIVVGHCSLLSTKWI